MAKFHYIGLFFHGGVWYTRLSPVNRKLWRYFMNEREKIIRLWFDMWIKKADLGIDNIFTDDVVYTES